MNREFLNDRRAAFLSLNEIKIRKYCAKYGVAIPEDSLSFWSGVHKARIEMKDIPEVEKQKSRRWLANRGFKTLTGQSLEEWRDQK